MGAWGHDGLWGGGVKTGVLWARVSKKELHLEHGEGLKWGATAPGLRIRTGSVHLGEGALFTRITCSAGRCGWQVPGAPWRTQAPSGASFLEVEAWLGPRGASVVMSWGAGPGCEIGGYPCGIGQHLPLYPVVLQVPSLRTKGWVSTMEPSVSAGHRGHSPLNRGQGGHAWPPPTLLKCK